MSVKVRLDDVLKYEQPTNYIVESTNYNDSFPIPVLTAGKSFILGYTDETHGVFNDFPVIIFDDFTTAFHYVDFPFKVKSSAMKILKPIKEKADLRYLFYKMHTISLDTDLHKRYWISKYSQLQIPLPPLPTQQKIAAILDAADALRQKDKALQAKYDELTQALFLDMFGDVMKNPKQFPIKLLEELCEEIIDCPHSTPNYVEYNTEFPCIRTTELDNGAINWSKMKYLNYEGYIERTKRLVPKEGDIIYGREGSFGEAAIVPVGCKMSLGQRVMLFRPNSNLINSKFLHAVVRSNGVYKQALRVTSGSTVGHINVKDIKKFKLIVAPLGLQNQFAERVQAIEEQKAKAQASLEKAEELFNSLLQRAFKGELV